MAKTKTEDVIVPTKWLADNLGKPGIRVVEVDVDTTLYEKGHVPGAAGWNWTTELQDQLRRDVLAREDFEDLLSRTGIGNDTTVALYGDNNNWFAAYAFWLLKVYGHEDVRLVDGGRVKWTKEKRPLATEVPTFPRTAYRAKKQDPTIRATRVHVLDAVRKGRVPLVDVRSPDEFTGKILAPPGLSETAQRGGHIPGALSIPWSQAVNAEDGTFKPADDLQRIYVSTHGLDPKRETIAYCRIGERSSHTWFVLKHLLGFPKVRNYDGSWTEYGNLVGVPIEKGLSTAPSAGPGPTIPRRP